MIARIWRGVTPAAKAGAYFAYLQATGLKDYRSIEGNRSVQVLRHIQDGQAEFLLLSFWDSYDAIRRFAGDDFETAVYYPEDKDFLLAMEPKVMHYEILEM